MEAKRVSRRSMLRGAAALGLSPIVARLGGIFPEAGVVLGKEQPALPGFAHAPDDMIVRQIEGPRAATLLSQAFADPDVARLLDELPHLRPVATEARVASATWSRGKANATLVAVPFTSDAGADAALFYAVTDDVPSHLMVAFPNPADRTQAAAYSVVGGRVTKKDAFEAVAQAQATTASSCTVNCIIGCLPSWGCGGLPLALCTGALVGCGMLFFPSCIAAVICSFWCGYAFSQCTGRCCGGAGGGF